MRPGRRTHVALLLGRLVRVVLLAKGSAGGPDDAVVGCM